MKVYLVLVDIFEEDPQLFAFKTLAGAQGHVDDWLKKYWDYPLEEGKKDLTWSDEDTWLVTIKILEVKP